MKNVRLCSDIITALPPSIIENILSLVLIQEAARTSILSKEWRYIWTKNPKLVFNYDTIHVPPNENDNQWQIKSRKLINAVNQVMSLRRAPILDFTLDMDVDDNDTCVEVDRMLNDLFRNNSLDRLSLDLTHGFRLPSDVFSLHQLTDVSLRNCDIYHQSNFNGFRSVTRFCLHDVNILTKTLLHLLSSCPLLEDFTLLLCQDNIPSNEFATVIELFECFPLVKHFTTWGWLIPCLAEVPFPRELPTSLIRLKSLSLDTVCFVEEYGLPFLIMLIRSSPNMEKLKLEVYPEGLDDYWKNDLDYVTKKKFSDVWLEYLNEFEIEGVSNLKPELDFVKLILAKSPVLKKARIILNHCVTKDEEIQAVTTTILRFAHASPEVEILVDCPQYER